jgi:hypothetical protein
VHFIPQIISGIQQGSNHITQEERLDFEDGLCAYLANLFEDLLTHDLPYLHPMYDMLVMKRHQAACALAAGSDTVEYEGELNGLEEICEMGCSPQSETFSVHDQPQQLERLAFAVEVEGMDELASSGDDGPAPDPKRRRRAEVPSDMSASKAEDGNPGLSLSMPSDVVSAFATLKGSLATHDLDANLPHYLEADAPGLDASRTP